MYVAMFVALFTADQGRVDLQKIPSAPPSANAAPVARLLCATAMFETFLRLMKRRVDLHNRFRTFISQRGPYV